MLSAAQTAVENIATLHVTAYMLLGVAVGLVVGLLPGIGGSSGMALLLPFLYGMDATAGISMLIGFAAVGYTIESFGAVLLGVPSGGGSQSLILDGHQLARKGQASRALGAGFSASLIGGIIGAVVLLAVLTAARPLIHAVKTPELLILTLFGLLVVGILVRGDSLLGLLSAVFGVMLATIGGAPAIAEYRYTFGSLYLHDGLSIVVVTMGIFGLPEVIALFVNRKPISASKLEGDIVSGFRETLRHSRLLIGSSIVGTVVGAVPGMGGTVANWMAYGLAKQSGKNTENFGKGDIRGVIAPEAANNSVEAGGLIPTLALGIPGSASTAVMLGGLVLLGVSPGPQMLEKQMDLMLTVVWTLVVANIIATAFCMLLARPIAKVTLVRGELLAPFLLVIFLLGAFQATQNIHDIVAVIVLGVLGYAMKLANWPRVPAIVGFVLAPSIERYLHLSMSRYGYEWMVQPGVLSLVAAGLLLAIAGPAWRHLSTRLRRTPAESTNGAAR